MGCWLLPLRYQKRELRRGDGLVPGKLYQEAHLRVAGRHGLRKRPTSIVEVGLLQLEETRRQTSDPPVWTTNVGSSTVSERREEYSHRIYTVIDSGRDDACSTSR